MKYKFNEVQINNFIKISDLALKASGYKSLDKILYIVNILRNNLEYTCEFTNVDMTIIERMFDDAIRSYGLNTADIILEITNILRNPLSEEITNDVVEIKNAENTDNDVSKEIEDKE